MQLIPNESDVQLLQAISMELQESREALDNDTKALEELSRAEYDMSYEDGDYFDNQLTPLEIAEDRVRDGKKLVRKKTVIQNHIAQAVSYKLLYPSGYKRAIKEQTYVDVQDGLNRKHKAKEIAKVVLDTRVKSVGVFGEWGTGKSTFLEYIKNEIPALDNKIIDIKATEYGDQEGIWSYIFAKMNESTEKDSDLRRRFYWHKVKKNKKLYRVIFPVLLTIILSIILFKFDLFKDFGLMLGADSDVAENFSNNMNWFVIILFFIKLIFPLVKEVQETLDIAMDSIRQLSGRDVKEKLGYKAIVKEYIGELIEVWSNYHFIIFVDELDRCNNQTIMSFLESIQLLEDYKNIKIIYAIDSDVILNAIKESGIRNPENYLKKYVDIKVYLESINTHSEYIENIAKSNYDFNEREIALIQKSIMQLGINISIRDCLHIFNSLSEMKERWITDEVLTKKYQDESIRLSLLNWEDTITLAIFYLTGSMWSRSLFQNIDMQSDDFIKIGEINDDKISLIHYYECPRVLREIYIVDVKNAYNYLRNMPPIQFSNS